MEHHWCPECYYESSGLLCGRWGCEHPACTPCADERFYAAHPLEAAERDYQEAERLAQEAYEGDWDDWRAYQSEAQAAARHLAEVRADAGFEDRE